MRYYVLGFILLISINSCDSFSSRSKAQYLTDIFLDTVGISDVEIAKTELTRGHPFVLPFFENNDSGSFSKTPYLNDSFLYKTEGFLWHDFKKEVDYQNLEFSQPLQIFDCSFVKAVSFSQTLFKRSVVFESTDFNSYAGFLSCKFIGFTDFKTCQFKQGVSFSNSDFRRAAWFDRAEFHSDADFATAHFSDYASFKYLNLTKNSYFNFSGAILPHNLDFSFNKILPNGIDLTKCSFLDSTHYSSKEDMYFAPHYISLYKSDISKFHLDYIHFRLVTDSFASDELLRNKSKIPYEEVTGMYEALLNNFKTRGQLESYKLCDIEYQQYKLKHSSVAFLAPVYLYWWNFGYNKEYVFVWTAFFILLFTFINFFCLGYLQQVYALEKLGDVPVFSKRRFSVRDSLRRSWQSFVYAATIFFRLTLKVDDMDYRRVPGVIYIFLMYTIGIVCLAYMANYVIQK